MKEVKTAADKIIQQLETVIFGKRNVLQMVLVCLLAEGHLLMEDVPGTAKTLLGKALARTLGGTFRRLQCTPDLLPGDVTGTNIFNQKTQEFQFHAGPVFTQILLADEVNRATPRAQAALLECMAEGQISVENRTYLLKRPFFVIATQNPVEHEGTFALPEAQLDRFLMRLTMGYPSFKAEDLMLIRDEQQDPLTQVKPVVRLEDMVLFQDQVRKVHVEPKIREYIIRVAASTRNHSDFILGAGPRATKGLYRACQARAAITGRNFVLPDDVKQLFPTILYHRVILSAEGRLNRRSVNQAVDKAVGIVPAPLVEPGSLEIER
ncbi:MAG: MoxR family ATPase [Candidatus Aminicenantes bacterium]|jgi:MoxR-like ATPase